MTLSVTRPWVISLSVLVSLAVGACGGKTLGVGGKTVGDGGITMVDVDGAMCVDVPPATASDLACEADSDCTSVWSGSVCYGECDCASGPGNTAYQARTQTSILSILSGPSACSCPSLGFARCFAHQCTICAYGSNQPAKCQLDGGAGGDTGTVTLDAGTRDSGTTTSDSGTTTTDSGTTTIDSGSFVNDAGQKCVDIDLSTYDISCTQASDCTTILSGTVCDGTCACGGQAINVAGEARYATAVSGIVLGDCPYPAEQPPLCSGGNCFIPTP